MVFLIWYGFIYKYFENYTLIQSDVKEEQLIVLIFNNHNIYIKLTVSQLKSILF